MLRELHILLAYDASAGVRNVALKHGVLTLTISFTCCPRCFLGHGFFRLFFFLHSSRELRPQRAAALGCSSTHGGHSGGIPGVQDGRTTGWLNS